MILTQKKKYDIITDIWKVIKATDEQNIERDWDAFNKAVKQVLDKYKSDKESETFFTCMLHGYIEYIDHAVDGIPIRGMEQA